MDAAEKESLQTLGNDVAGAMQSMWEPRCIARAFATPAEGTIALTMQGWIDLEALQSPLLMGQPPENIEDLDAAAAVFGLVLEKLNAEELMVAAQVMLRAVGDAFSTSLKMRPPGETGENDGFGSWLPLWGFLTETCRIHADEAMAWRVDRAHARLAIWRRNQGWTVAGPTYALRDVEQPAVEAAT